MKLIKISKYFATPNDHAPDRQPLANNMEFYEDKGMDIVARSRITCRIQVADNP
ncbi:MAG: hypothetical protein VW373_07730 [Halieaceae bacterium]